MRRLRMFLDEWMTQRHLTKQLVSIVLANPQFEFVERKMLPIVDYWHLRSRDAVLFAFLGYAISPESQFPASATFDPTLFNEAIEEIERGTSILYTGRTMLVLTVAKKEEWEVQFDYDWVLDFDIEGLIAEGAISDIRVLFEDLIRLAKAHPADDALWAFENKASDEGKHEAFMGVAEQYIPFLKNARKVAQAHTRFRVRKRSRD